MPPPPQGGAGGEPRDRGAAPPPGAEPGAPPRERWRPADDALPIRRGHRPDAAAPPPARPPPEEPPAFAPPPAQRAPVPPDDRRPPAEPPDDRRRGRRRGPDVDEPPVVDRRWGRRRRRRGPDGDPEDPGDPGGPGGERGGNEPVRNALGLGGAAPASDRWIDGGGRFGTAAHNPILGWYDADAATLELPIGEEMAKLRAAGVLGGGPGEAAGHGSATATIPPPPPPPPVLDPGGAALVEPVLPSPTGLPEPAPAEPPEEPTGPKLGASQRSSFLVAAGILLSRSAGLIREVVISNYLGTTAAADAFKAALRIPNMLQNLLGEGVLSASFIPVYARMRAEEGEEEAGRLAGAICGLLLALSSVLIVIGVVFAQPVTRLLVTGFSGDARFDLTVQLVRIMFPAMGLMPLSAWCLGVLNSHRKFFLAYVAPVLWNAGQIVAVVAVALTGATSTQLATALAWGVVAGSIGEVAIQLPSVLKVLGRLRLSINTRIGGVRSVLSRFGPVVMGRGVVQILGFVDLWLAAFLAVGAVSSLTYAQVLYLLPISVFGMSVAAAELPDLSRVKVHDPETRRVFRRRLEDGLGRILFYVAFTATLFIVVGDVIVRALLQRGALDADDTTAIWFVIAAFSLGLPATTASRLLQNGLYALDDARTPARLAVVRVIVASLVGLAVMFPLDRLTIVDGAIHGWDDIFALGPLPQSVRENVSGTPHLGMVGLALGAAVSSWVEYRLLSQALAWRIGRSYLGGRWISAIAAGCVVTAVVAFLLEQVFGDRHALIAGALVLGPSALVYLAVTSRLGVPEAKAMVDRGLSLVRSRHRG
ncbi:MAG TPA: murein biosynthesis integral membrane protein MurJ [Acidimicrobiales bacterium]|nr:murein biosynthesis integral membrane protein MurJ [Acidimicrobiales bacterium]